MSRRTVAVRGVLFTFAVILVAPAIASQQAKPTRGARIAVVAIHDSRLLTLCPSYGKNVIAADGWQGTTGAEFVVGHPTDGVHLITGRFGNESVSRLFLPVPPSAAPSGAVNPAASSAKELDRLARDVEVQRRVEQQFRKLKTYTVVESVADADFVFLLESNYVPLAASSNQLPPSPRTDNRRDTPERIFSDSDNEWTRRQWRGEDRLPQSSAELVPGSFFVSMARGGDRYARWRESAIAIAVTGAAYRQHSGDGSALTAARLWQGVSAVETERGPAGPTVKAASPEVLVDRFHGKGAKHPDYLPVCAATNGTIRSIGDFVDPPSDGPRESIYAPDPLQVREPKTGLFRSNITLVTVPVTVSDSDGRSVADLQSSAFHIFEDGVEQKLDRINPGTSPSHIALVVDTSSGMRRANESIRATALSLVDSLRPNDRAMVVSFDGRIRVNAEPTSNRTELQRAISTLRPWGGGTRLYDALTLVLLDRLSAVNDRKTIVLFTDGVDTGSHLTDAAGTLAAVDTANVGVYIIRYDTSDSAIRMPAKSTEGQQWLLAPDDTQKSTEVHDAADQFLSRLATGSGGRMYFARGDSNVRELIAEVSQELSRQYVLCYYPTNDKLDGAYRQIRVTVDRPDHVVRARNGYRAGAMQTGR